MKMYLESQNKMILNKNSINIYKIESNVITILQDRNLPNKIQKMNRILSDLIIKKK